MTNNELQEKVKELKKRMDERQKKIKRLAELSNDKQLLVELEKDNNKEWLFDLDTKTLIGWLEDTQTVRELSRKFYTHISNAEANAAERISRVAELIEMNTKLSKLMEENATDITKEDLSEFKSLIQQAKAKKIPTPEETEFQKQRASGKQQFHMSALAIAIATIALIVAVISPFMGNLLPPAPATTAVAQTIDNEENSTGDTEPTSTEEPTNQLATEDIVEDTQPTKGTTSQTTVGDTEPTSTEEPTDQITVGDTEPTSTEEIVATPPPTVRELLGEGFINIAGDTGIKLIEENVVIVLLPPVESLSEDIDEQLFNQHVIVDPPPQGFGNLTESMDFTRKDGAGSVTFIPAENGNPATIDGIGIVNIENPIELPNGSIAYYISELLTPHLNRANLADEYPEYSLFLELSPTDYVPMELFVPSNSAFKAYKETFIEAVGENNTKLIFEDVIAQREFFQGHLVNDQDTQEQKTVFTVGNDKKSISIIRTTEQQTISLADNQGRNIVLGTLTKTIRTSEGDTLYLFDGQQVIQSLDFLETADRVIKGYHLVLDLSSTSNVFTPEDCPYEKQCDVFTYHDCLSDGSCPSIEVFRVENLIPGLYLYQEITVKSSTNAECFTFNAESMTANLNPNPDCLPLENTISVDNIMVRNDDGKQPPKTIYLKIQVMPTENSRQTIQLLDSNNEKPVAGINQDGEPCTTSTSDCNLYALTYDSNKGLQLTYRLTTNDEPVPNATVQVDWHTSPTMTGNLRVNDADSILSNGTLSIEAMTNMSGEITIQVEPYSNEDEKGTLLGESIITFKVGTTTVPLQTWVRLRPVGNEFVFERVDQDYDLVYGNESNKIEPLSILSNNEVVLYQRHDEDIYNHQKTREASGALYGWFALNSLTTNQQQVQLCTALDCHPSRNLLEQEYNLNLTVDALKAIQQSNNDNAHIIAEIIIPEGQSYALIEVNGAFNPLNADNTSLQIITAATPQVSNEISSGE